MIDPDTEVLRMLQQAAGGDEQAFARLLERYRPGLRAFIELRLGPEMRTRVDPSDVIQETQLEAFMRLADYLERHPMPFPLWLRRTAYERLLKMRRHHLAGQRQVTREVALPDQSSILLAQGLQAHAPGPIQQLCQGEQIAKVHHALALLPELDREILLMRHVEELPYEDIGHILGMEAATARKRYGRALLRLRKAFFADGEGTSDA